MFNSTLSYYVFAGDILVAEIPFEFLDQARAAYPASIGYRFERV